MARAWSPEHGVRVVTLAPELPGAVELIGYLVSAGVVVSAGHSAATFEEGVTAIDAGVTCATHLFNGMAPLGHRDPGLVAALLRDERVTLGLIADGVHVHPSVVDLVWRIAGPRVLLVSDAIAALGMPAGRYRLGAAEMKLDSGRARIDGRLAGSVSALDASVRNLARFTGASVADVVATVTATPARLLRMEAERGSLEAGRIADVVALTPELEVAATIVAGQVVHTTERTAAWA
jgi:N-acetylglucosamine-6-phosphate deacetylase